MNKVTQSPEYECNNDDDHHPDNATIEEEGKRVTVEDVPKEIAKDVEMMEHVVNLYPLPPFHLLNETTSCNNGAEDVGNDEYEEEAPITMDQIDLLKALLERHVQLLLQQAVLATREHCISAVPGAGNVNVKIKSNQAKNADANDAEVAMGSSIMMLSELKEVCWLF